ncbi:PREDICTED: paramyosin-like [Priapulus caudatus]|uniref:Paramyosin-like n=1 Tax=Priapulus caudatus TaxID=37621 RepID=A0ABM1EDP6_PRICU|nr:PREDICTED: paramyosin-like [Priapulus caudatus]
MLVVDLRHKNEELAMEAEEARRHAARLQGELDKAKKELLRLEDENKQLKRDLAKLTGDLRDANERISQQEKTIQELNVTITHLEADNKELQDALREEEAARKHAETRCKELALELQYTRAEYEKKLQMLQDQMEALRKQMQMELDALIVKMADMEARHKAEVNRLKKKFMAEINELEMALESANAARLEAERKCKALAAQLKDLQGLYEDCQRQLQQTLDQMNALQRRCLLLQSEIEEVRSSLEITMRQKKNLELELDDAQGPCQRSVVSNVRCLWRLKSKLEAELAPDSQSERWMTSAPDFLSHLQMEARQPAQDAAMKAEGGPAVALMTLRQRASNGKSSSNVSNADAGGRAFFYIKDLQVRWAEVRRTNAMVVAKPRQIAKMGAGCVIPRLSWTRRGRSVLAWTRASRSATGAYVSCLSRSRTNNARIRCAARRPSRSSRSRSQSYKRGLDEQEAQNQNVTGRLRRYQRELEDSESRAEQAESNLSVMRSKHHTVISSGRRSSLVIVDERAARRF